MDLFLIQYYYWEFLHCFWKVLVKYLMQLISYHFNYQIHQRLQTLETLAEGGLPALEQGGVVADHLEVVLVVD